MRNKIRKYDKLLVTAVKERDGAPYIELEIDNEFVSLDRTAMIDLIRTLELALLEGVGYAATDKARKDIEYK